jgi:lipoyl(octanoyl) transferase
MMNGMRTTTNEAPPEAQEAPVSEKPGGEGRELRWSWLGRVPYADGVALQERLRGALRAGTGPEHLLLLEHPHVYTLGRNATPEDVVLAPEALAARGIEVAESDRGGQVTYHGPGQLVGYPVIDLDPDRRDVRRYVHDLQETLIRTLAEYGIEARRRDGQAFVGVWVGDEKIASLGIHLKRWITTHGFALNVTTELDFFSGIVACGLPDVRLTSIVRLTGAAPPLPEVAARYAAHFAAVFGRRAVEVEAAALLAGVGRA